jgi:virginiamycin B lyase
VHPWPESRFARHHPRHEPRADTHARIGAEVARRTVDRAPTGCASMMIRACERGREQPRAIDREQHIPAGRHRAAVLVHSRQHTSLTALDSRRRLLVLIAVVVAASLGVPAQVRASTPGFVFFGYGLTVGRASVTGAGVDPSFIQTGDGSASAVVGVAADGQHVYWANYPTAGHGTSGSIGRANVSGTDVTQQFIPLAEAPLGLAVDGQHIYWGTPEGYIGRANLDGTDVRPRFIDLGSVTPVHGVAVDSDHIYWAERTSIGRANLDGTGVTQNFIYTSDAEGIAVDSEHIYWAGRTADRISRADLDGTHVNTNFIVARSPGELVPGGGLAVHAGRIYWGNNSESNAPSPESIGTANILGTGRLDDLIKLYPGGGPDGVAVSATGAIPTAGSDVEGLQFGRHTVGDFSPVKTVTISDVGTAPLRGVDVRISGGDARDFLIVKNGCSGNVLPPNGGCAIDLRFGPRAVGSRSSTLNVRSDDPLSPLALALSGTGESAIGKTGTDRAGHRGRG